MAAALLLIDLQEAIRDPAWARHGPRNNPGAESNQAVLLALWRARGDPVIHIRHDSKVAGSAYRAGTPGHAFLDHARPLPGETIVAKTVNCAFIGTDLEAHLRSRGIEVLVVAGVITNNSVEATVRVAGNLGFDVRLVGDACFTFAVRDGDGRVHAAENVHALSLANMAGEYAEIVGTAAVLHDC
ncbi:isochorismatase [Polymorphobacter glacialis]|uniref:Isochorismatase n=1 Tax=Sandarakinorhabdus glacialis TaxID=1614636 RepID=A0A916ZZZ2_9SPHN|nr:cysteine hydrolase family protein [Polymorphobacter glacialis]GGE18660.1 isochorismatase [Polymorphobacter glacialis]